MAGSLARVSISSQEECCVVLGRQHPSPLCKPWRATEAAQPDLQRWTPMADCHGGCSEAGVCALEDCAFRGLRVSEQGPLGPGWLCRCTWRPAPALGHGDARVSQGERAGCGANQPLLTPWLPAYCLGALQGASATRPVNGHCRHSYGHCNKSPQTQLLK